MELKDELRQWARREDDWAQAYKDGRALADLGDATVSLWAHQGGRCSVIVSVKAGTDLFDDSLSVSLQGEPGPRMVEALCGIADLDSEVLEWVIDRLDAANAVAGALLRQGEGASDEVQGLR
jgi:hypothetical protein